MNKKGFTLIELLAVIVILAIIALIATPIILNVIEKARIGSVESSALGYIDAVEKQVMVNELDNDKTNNITDGTYEINDLNSKDVTVKGQKPTEGWLLIEKGQVVDFSFKIDNYYVNPSENNASKVLADKSGELKTKPNEGTVAGLYVYATFGDGTNGDGVITKASEGRTTKPSDKNAYLRYTLSNGEIVSGLLPETCTYSDELGELCLKYNEPEISKSKILEYYGFDENTWTKKTGYQDTWEYNNIECSIDHEYNGNGILTTCRNHRTRDNIAYSWTINAGETPNNSVTQWIKTGAQDYLCVIDNNHVNCDEY